MSTRSLELVSSLPMMPLIPQVIKSMYRSNNEFDILKFADMVTKEPTLSAKLIGYANSPLYRSDRSIKTVRDAVVRIGVSQTKDAIFPLMIGSVIHTPDCPSFSLATFWYNFMMKGQFARCMLTRIPQRHAVNSDEIYCISLVSGLGLLLMVRQYPMEMSQIFREDSDETPITERIKKRFNGHGYHFFSGKLMEHWGLPASYVETLVHMDDEDYDGAYQNEIRILNFSRALFKAVDRNYNLPTEMSADGISLDEAQIQSITNCVFEEHTFIKGMADHMRPAGNSEV